MASIEPAAIWELTEAIAGFGGKGDEQPMLATVVRKDEDGTIWVLMSGSAEETPVNGFANANVSVGDTVCVSIAGGRLSLVGNQSSPAVGTDAIDKAMAESDARLMETAGRLDGSIAAARDLALEAVDVAYATEQHFWHRATDPEHDGAGVGAFVTDEEQEDFIDAVAHDVQPTEFRPLHNLLMNAEGILLRAAKRIRAAFTPSGVAFYDGEGNNASNIVASFGSSGAVVGKSSDKRIMTTSSAVSVVDADGTAQATFGTNLTMGRVSSYNTLISSAAIYLRNATTYLARITGSALQFYDGAGNAAANIMAEFGSTLARIGKTTQSHVNIDSTSVKFYEAGTAASNVVASFGSDGATIGKTSEPNIKISSEGLDVSSKEIGGMTNRIIASFKRRLLGYLMSTPTYESYMKVADDGGAYWIEIASGGANNTDIFSPSITSSAIGLELRTDGSNKAVYVDNGNIGSDGNISASGNITADGYVSARSVTTTGAQVIKDSRLDRDGAVSSDVGSYVHGIQDKDGENVAYFQASQYASGGIRAALVALNEKSDGTQVYNDISVEVSKSGARAVQTHSSVIANSGNLIAKSGNLESNNTVSSTTNGVGHFLWDKNGTTIGTLIPQFYNNGTQAVALYAQRTVNGTNKFNNVTLGIKPDGNFTVSLAAPAEWRAALGVTGSSEVKSILSNSTWTILAWGPFVMVQCHGATAAANNTTMLNGTLSSYKPDYNVSTIVADASGSNHVARMYVEASTGSVKLASVGYTTSAAWYGTLVYMRK